MACNLKTACLRLTWHDAQQYVLSVSSSGRLQYFHHLEKVKKQNAFLCKF